MLLGWLLNNRWVKCMVLKNSNPRNYNSSNSNDENESYSKSPNGNNDECNISDIRDFERRSWTKFAFQAARLISRELLKIIIS